jgi:ribosomal protein L11 methylase PrmA
MILGGVLADEAEEVSSAASEVGFQLAEDDVEEGWWAAAFSG